MSLKKGIRFIRKRGRIIPIRHPAGKPRMGKVIEKKDKLVPVPVKGKPTGVEISNYGMVRKIWRKRQKSDHDFMKRMDKRIFKLQGMHPSNPSHPMYGQKSREWHIRRRKLVSKLERRISDIRGQRELRQKIGHRLFQDEKWAPKWDSDKYWDGATDRVRNRFKKVSRGRIGKKSKKNKKTLEQKEMDIFYKINFDD